MKLTDKQLERIVKRANSKKIIKECEPQVAFPMQIDKWMVRRVLVAAFGYEVRRE
jgi:uncharacterized protein YpbB